LTEEQLQILQDLPEEERQADRPISQVSRQGAETPTGAERERHTLGAKYDEAGAPARPRGTVGTLGAEEQLKRLKALQDLKEPPFREAIH
jgi:hypothetical protein